MTADPCDVRETASIAGAPTERATERLGTAPADIARAGDMLARGELVAFPTETVYGLGANARDAQAVAALYAAKERPRFNPLIAHLPSAEAALRAGIFDANARLLAQAFWPGPLTLVVPLMDRSGICDLARSGLDSVALRVPAHPVARALLEAAGVPVVAPSANRSGRVSPTHEAHVVAELDGRIDAILAGGATRVGVESTIVACLASAPHLLRAGGVPSEEIEAVLKVRLARAPSSEEGAPLAPGALASHYAPRARVRLGAREARAGEAALAFGPELPGEAAISLNLSRTGNLAEAAANLFGFLRELDAAQPDVIAVAPVPEGGLGEAINDRLRRAASER